MFPKTQVQLCIVHLIRNSLKFVNWKDRKHVVPDLRAIYSAPTAEAAWQQLIQFGEKWDKTYNPIRPLWERNWQYVTPFFAFPLEVRKIIYSTNAVESLNMCLRKIIKMRGSFPTEEAVLKLLYLAIRNVTAKWDRSVDWTAALNQFAVLWGERINAIPAAR
jgi:putative transposase